MECILEKRYLCFPIKCGAKPIKTRFEFPDYTIVVSLELTTEKPDFWVYYDAQFTMGSTVRIIHEEENEVLCAADVYVFSDRPLGDIPVFEEQHRPLYHFTNARGWVNDPNGLLYKDGWYHMFYQLNNFGSRWYDKGWGHARSRNLFDWEILPPALYADDSGYAISGSALFDPENRAGFGKDAWILMYSSRFDGMPEKGQFQNIAYSNDGHIFHKYKNNPIMEDPTTVNFRDPKVFWYEPAKHFVMVLACGPQVRFYTSVNLRDWEQSGILEDSLINPDHRVYECPELMEYRIEGEENSKWVLSVSIDIYRKVLFIIGDFDGRNFVYDPDTQLQWADYGKDFYAAVAWNPQYEMADRKLWIGWMCFWPYARQCPKEEGWMGAFTVPRELRLVRHKNKKLYMHQNPAKEIAVLEQKEAEAPKEITLNGGKTYELLAGEAFSLSFKMEQQSGKSGKSGIILHYESGETVEIIMDYLQNKLVVDRSNCDGADLGHHYLEPLTAPLEGREITEGKEITEVKVLADKGCIELFVNDGLICLAALCFPKEHSCKISFYNKQETKVRFKNIILKPIRRAEWKY
jgi:fructan beta-fructosidase